MSLALLVLPALAVRPAGAAEDRSAPPRVEAPSPAQSADADALHRLLSPGEVPPCERIVKIEIRKWDHVLRATCGEGQVREFPIALGRRPFGDKQRQGDLRTPEGYYRVVEPPRPSQFHVFIPLDYPSVVDADAALERGDISNETYLRIVRALLRGELPPQDTALGGAIGIHGEGPANQGRTAHGDWTLGCVALDDRAARFVAERIDVGTPVWIRP